MISDSRDKLNKSKFSRDSWVSCKKCLLLLEQPSLCLGVCLLCTRFSTHFSVVRSDIACAGDHAIRLLLEVWKCMKTYESRSSLGCNQNIKEDVPTALEVFLYFASKQNDTNKPTTKTSTQRASNIRERTRYNT